MSKTLIIKFWLTIKDRMPSSKSFRWIIMPDEIALSSCLLAPLIDISVINDNIITSRWSLTAKNTLNCRTETVQVDTFSSFQVSYCLLAAFYLQINTTVIHSNHVVISFDQAKVWVKIFYYDRIQPFLWFHLLIYMTLPVLNCCFCIYPPEIKF